MFPYPFPILLLPILLLFANLFSTQDVQRVGVIDLCNGLDAKSCGFHGQCRQFVTGSRCQCPEGLMGPGCKRPCQDVQHSCERWRRQGRCQWHKSIVSPFFIDNCALTCGFCRDLPKQKKLNVALPPILEPIAWLIGRWQTHTIGNRTDRFPAPLSGPYIEILDVQIAAPPAFDRPSLNVSIRAWTTTPSTADWGDEHNELGFLTVKLANEQTGFVSDHGLDTSNDRIALELASNTGVLIIEEGQLIGGQKQLELETTWHIQYPSIAGTEKKDNRIKLDFVRRAFVLIEPNVLEERLDYVQEKDGGKRRKVMKRFRKIHDYFA